MIQLPEEFTGRMKQQLADAYEDFLASYEEESSTGLRVNTGRITPEAFERLAPFALRSVPWTSNGYYYRRGDAVTKHPYYYAGLYYIQEPSAMVPASTLPISPGDLVLDLCAAPGGKATELSSRLGGEGLLIANDASASRAKALFKNLAVWGSPNCCITCETPQRLYESFGCCFDKILVDAPCSGEGMFRRDTDLISSWKERGPAYYAPIQKEILSWAVRMLRPGGMLLYSTCTFSTEEDEEVIGAVLADHPELTLVEPVKAAGFADGCTPYEKCIRIWPHRVEGEGHFAALLRRQSKEERHAFHLLSEDKTDTEHYVKKGQGIGLERYSKAELVKSHKNMPKEVRDFLEEIPERIWKNCFYVQAGDQCLLLPPYRLPGHVRFLRTGILAGTYKKGRFEPSQQLAMLLDRNSFRQVLDLSAQDERVIRYLKGETIALTDQESAGRKGWVLVCVDGYALGWGKFAGMGMKNKYYPGWRLQ